MYKSKLLFSLLIICFLFNFSLNLFSTEIKISKKLYGFTIDDSWYDEVKIEVSNLQVTENKKFTCKTYCSYCYVQGYKSQRLCFII